MYLSSDCRFSNQCTDNSILVELNSIPCKYNFTGFTSEIHSKKKKKWNLQRKVLKVQATSRLVFTRSSSQSSSTWFYGGPKFAFLSPMNIYREIVAAIRARFVHGTTNSVLLVERAEQRDERGFENKSGQVPRITRRLDKRRVIIVSRWIKSLETLSPELFETPFQCSLPPPNRIWILISRVREEIRLCAIGFIRTLPSVESSNNFRKDLYVSSHLCIFTFETTKFKEWNLGRKLFYLQSVFFQRAKTKCIGSTSFWIFYIFFHIVFLLYNFALWNFPQVYKDSKSSSLVVVKI